MTTTQSTDDVVRLLKEDHRQVEVMLGRFDTIGAAEREDYFCNLTHELVRHEVAEETVVYPAVRKVPGGDQVADARIAEQSDAEELLAKMEKLDPKSAEFASDFATLKAAVLAHATAEEQTAFAMLDADVAPDKRRELGQRYVKAKEAAPTHPHPHAPDTPPGNTVLGPVAALVDKIRDAAKSA